jgi:hypothetical protein
VSDTIPAVPVNLFISHDPAWTPGSAPITVNIQNDDGDPPVITGLDPAVVTLSGLTYVNDAFGARYTGTVTAVGTGTCTGTVTIDGAVNGTIPVTVEYTTAETGTVVIGTPVPPAPPAPAA